MRLNGMLDWAVVNRSIMPRRNNISTSKATLEHISSSRATIPLLHRRHSRGTSTRHPSSSSTISKGGDSHRRREGSSGVRRRRLTSSSDMALLPPTPLHNITSSNNGHPQSHPANPT